MSQACAQPPLPYNIYNDYQLPDWFVKQRVSIHSRVNAVYYKNPDHAVYGHWAEKVIAPLGGSVFVRHIKSDEGPVNWKSAWGVHTRLADKRNIIAEAVQEAHQHNTRIIGYYNHFTDRYMQINHPEFVCKDVAGKPVLHNRGTVICINSPYGDSVAVRLAEFAKMGGDGIYFDEIHMPRQGCWCRYCQQKFKKQTGLKAPSKIDASALYRKYQDFNNSNVVEVFAKWRAILSAINPQLVMIVGSNTLPKLTDRHLNTDLFRVAQVHKTEWDLGLKGIRKMPEGVLLKPNEAVWRGLSYNFSRDITGGRPAHYWIKGMSFVPPDHINAATAGIISFGNIANLDMLETAAPDWDFDAAMKTGAPLGPAFFQAKPMRWLLIHYNEKALAAHPCTAQDGWTYCLGPLYGAYNAAQQMKVPVGFITDSQMEEGLFQGAQLLFLPNSEYLSDQSRKQLKKFSDAGGVIIKQESGWDWLSGDIAFIKATKALQKKLRSLSGDNRIQASRGSTFFHVNYFEKMEKDQLTYLAAFSNNLNWIVSETTQAEATEGLAKSRRPPPVSGIVLQLKRPGVPLAVRNVQTKENIPYKKISGSIHIDVPTFRDALFIEIVYRNPQ
ncbi:hypothetical protein ABDK00_008980 [Niabella insulamsoli]|uniref:hypothetical protein n=1 Tax=Niabella insulamsoli TaxID=3144874 RepID=UPI0031FCC677